MAQFRHRFRARVPQLRGDLMRAWRCRGRFTRLALAAGGALLLVVVTGCDVGRSGAPSPTGIPSRSPSEFLSPGTPTQSASQVIQSYPIPLGGGPARVELLGVDRSAAETVTVRYRIVNEEGRDLDLTGRLSDHDDDSGEFGATNAVSLVDGVHNKRYFPLTTTDNACLCSNVKSLAIPEGESADLYAVFPSPPAELSRITVWVPLTPLFLDVPIGDTPQHVAEQTIDPATASLREPKIRSLISTVDGDGQSTEEDDENESVRLSADVLFAINKAKLTPRAKALLQRVASRIDASTDKTVKIEGHTDSTGTDRINNPLSRRRAQAVERQLRGLVTRGGVTYQSAGFGSKRPIAKNTTAQGRKKNRRVTVTFTKPAPEEPTPVPSTPAATTSTPQPTGGDLPVIASTTGKSQDVTLDVNSLHRSPTGLVSLVWTVTNNSNERFYATSTFWDYRLAQYRRWNTAGVQIVDASTRNRYLAVRDSAGACVCTITAALGAKGIVDPGESATYYVTYKASQTVRDVDIYFSWKPRGVETFKPLPRLSID